MNFRLIGNIGLVILFTFVMAPLKAKHSEERWSTVAYSQQKDKFYGVVLGRANDKQSPAPVLELLSDYRGPILSKAELQLRFNFARIEDVEGAISECKEFQKEIPVFINKTKILAQLNCEVNRDKKVAYLILKPGSRENTIFIQGNFRRYQHVSVVIADFGIDALYTSKGFKAAYEKVMSSADTHRHKVTDVSRAMAVKHPWEFVNSISSINENRVITGTAINLSSRETISRIEIELDSTEFVVQMVTDDILDEIYSSEKNKRRYWNTFVNGQPIKWVRNFDYLSNGGGRYCYRVSEQDKETLEKIFKESTIVTIESQIKLEEIAIFSAIGFTKTLVKLEELNKETILKNKEFIKGFGEAYQKLFDD